MLLEPLAGPALTITVTYQEEGGGGRQDAGSCCGLQRAAPIGLSPLYRCPSLDPSPSAGGGMRA